ncbi:MAG: DUF1549 domain-containing protein, partial [Planctomycetales bacterium]|nr:DUF1549 domain-containing protein [Planctomycetales bacterium]
MIGASYVAADDALFREKVLPLLTNRCFRCHGPDEETLEAGLHLDRFKSATAELDSGARAIVPGDSDASELIVRVTTDDDDLRMPPIDTGDRLRADEVAILKSWIDSGGKYSAHWSFVSPVASKLPNVSNASWARNAIDRFVLARLDQEGLQPQPQANLSIILRRISLDLTGLPPTPEEVDRFVADNNPDAYERAVDRLLNSKAYGERWARIWLDLARYADSAGYAQDPLRTIWRYRDWVIKSINDNKPFDQFTIEQLAGDMLPNATDDQILATAFHRNTMTNSEGGTDDEEFRNAAIIDRVNTTMQVWMGMTMGCAQCHSHKYDP